MTTETQAVSLAARLRTQSNQVIDSKLQRLARRVPSLRQRDLAIIESALDDLVEHLLLEPLKKVPHRTDQLGRLFDTAN